MNRTTVFILFHLMSFSSVLVAQETIKVVIISDTKSEQTHLFEESIKAEINTLLSSKFNIDYTDLYMSGDASMAEQEIARVYAASQADVLITTGIISSQVLSNREIFPIPSIASIQLTDGQTSVKSNISNYTYLESPFNIKEGIMILREFCNHEKIAILAHPELIEIGASKSNSENNSDQQVKWIALENELSSTVDKIPDDVKGVYILSPLSGYSSHEIIEFFEKINARKLPSFTLLDSPMLNYGACASFMISDQLQKIPRRIALNVEKIIEGENPSEFSVEVEDFDSQLVLNMLTVNDIEVYPSWQVLDNALLININEFSSNRTISLKAAIAEGLEQNLGYQIERKQTQISGTDVSLSKTTYLPQLDIETTGFFLDENTVNGSFGTKGDFNWTAGTSFSQLILSEPAMANIAIQKLLYESQKEVQSESKLDVILEVSQNYFSYRQVLTVSKLQNENIKSISQNLSIAKDKEKVGYSGASDVYRWQIELDLAKTDLYNTNAQLKAARFQLNESLNRPIDDEFSIEETEELDELINGLDEIFVSLIKNQSSLNQLSDFLVNEALKNLPELEQMELALSAQERLLKSNNRAFYLPTISFGGTYEYPLEIINPGEQLPIPGVEIDINPSWNAAFSLSIPLFSGTSRKYERKKSQIGLYQLQDQLNDLKNLLELRVRSNLEVANSSFNNIRLTKSAAEAAKKNVILVQDLYKTGQVDVISLVDAQNSLLNANVNATNAIYQFMLDYFALQRSMGNYTYLETEDQRKLFLQRFIEFKNNSL